MNFIKNVSRLICKFILFIPILFLTIWADDEWCYLTVIVLLAYNLGFMPKEFQNFIENIVNKNIKIENLTNIEKTQQEILKKLDILILSAPQKCNTNFREQLSFSEFNIIQWFNKEKNIIFEQDKKIVKANNAIYIPDGICESRKKDIILEVKSCTLSYVNLLSLLQRFQSCLEQYNKSSKEAIFYLAIIVKNISLDNQVKMIQKAKNELCFNNLKVFLFEQKNNEIDLLKEI